MATVNRSAGIVLTGEEYRDAMNVGSWHIARLSEFLIGGGDGLGSIRIGEIQRLSAALTSWQPFFGFVGASACGRPLESDEAAFLREACEDIVRYYDDQASEAARFEWTADELAPLEWLQHQRDVAMRLLAALGGQQPT